MSRMKDEYERKQSQSAELQAQLTEKERELAEMKADWAEAVRDAEIEGVPNASKLKPVGVIRALGYKLGMAREASKTTNPEVEGLWREVEKAGIISPLVKAFLDVMKRDGLSRESVALLMVLHLVKVLDERARELERLKRDLEDSGEASLYWATEKNRIIAERDRRIAELEELLTAIGDYAHDHSTGPTVPDAELVSLRGQLSARTGLRKELEEALGLTAGASLEDGLSAIQALKADTVRLEKLAASATSNGPGCWYSMAKDMDASWPGPEDDESDPLRDLRTALDALHGPTEEV